MIEIRIHGRGGQGSVTMSELIAAAAFYSGKFSQGFPFFGVERRGAPVSAFVRLADKFIRLRSQIYEPDYIIIQDASLIGSVDVFAGAKTGAVVLLNTKKEIDKKIIPKGVRLKTINATGLALEIIGRPIVNTILLGAFAGLTGLIKLEAVERVIRERFRGEMAEKNVAAARKGYEVINNN